MKAIICTKSGSPEVLQLQDIDKPTPKESEVLVKVFASSVTRGDVTLRKLHPLMYIPMSMFGIKRKRIPGHEFAGVVEEIGKDVEGFNLGDKVFGTTTGLKAGANAEFVCVPEQGKNGVLTMMPANVGFDEAVVLPIGGMTALEILRRSNLKPGSKVLIYGASGSVGTYAVQLAKKYFKAQVTGVCSTTNLELVRSIGAEKVIDYTKEDFTQSGETYDVVFDAVGKISVSAVKNILKENGAFISVQSTTKESKDKLDTLKELVESGVVKPIIDKRFPLEQAAEAHRYVESGRKKGNVVITII